MLNLRERYHYKMHRRSEPRNICVGDVVIIHDDQEVRGFWKLGCVKELIVGTDGETRGALVQTLSGDRTSTVRCPVQKLYPLEINCEESPTELEAPNESIEDDPEQTVQSNPLFLIQSNLGLREQLLEVFVRINTCVSLLIIAKCFKHI